ncbi:hypothetical protein V8C37DRAFT_391140 [Trichoderma ceciliae]
MKQVPLLRYSRRLLLGSIGTSICYGAFAANSPIRFDSRQKSPTTQTQHQPLLSPDIIRQLSSGSIVGFSTGLVVSIFSRTLVLIGGVLTACYHLASSYKLGLPRIISFHKFLTEKVPLFKYGTRNGWFVASFALTFVLAAFVRL